MSLKINQLMALNTYFDFEVCKRYASEALQAINLVAEEITSHQREFQIISFLIYSSTSFLYSILLIILAYIKTHRV